MRSDFQRGYDRSTPILGGMVTSGDLSFAEPGSYGRRIKEERYRDGRYLVTMEVTDCKKAENGIDHPFLGSEWPVLWLLRALNWIAEVRRAAREPILEFGLQFITDNRHGFRLLALGEADSFVRRFSGGRSRQPQMVSSPIYEVGTGDAMLFAANEAFTDLFNSFGEDPRGARVPQASYEKSA